MEHIKDLDEFTIEMMLSKPKVDFRCLNVSEKDLKEWYDEIKDDIDDSVRDHEYDYLKNTGGSCMNTGEIFFR